MADKIDVAALLYQSNDDGSAQVLVGQRDLRAMLRVLTAASALDSKFPKGARVFAISNMSWEMHELRRALSDFDFRGKPS